jgi:hypothetical protein
MHPLILHELASAHVRDMRLTATVARRARQARRARRGYPAMARQPGAMARETFVQHV